jgi:hypothetical protein
VDVLHPFFILSKKRAYCLQVSRGKQRILLVKLKGFPVKQAFVLTVFFHKAIAGGGFQLSEQFID